MQEESRNPSHHPKQKKRRNRVASSAHKKPSLASRLELLTTGQRNENVKDEAGQQHDPSEEESRYARRATQYCDRGSPQRDEAS